MSPSYRRIGSACIILVGCSDPPVDATGETSSTGGPGTSSSSLGESSGDPDSSDDSDSVDPSADDSETSATVDTTSTDHGTTSEGETTAAETTTGVDEACGNGIVEDGELCDDGEPSLLCDADCTLAACGDGVVNPVANEDCELVDLGGASCESVGFDGGVLACTAACAHETSGCGFAPPPSTLTLGFSAIKRFDFSWTLADNADHYRLLESASEGDDFVQFGGDLVVDALSLSMPLHLRFGATYVLSACNEFGCTDSAPVVVVDSMVEAIGYFKSSDSQNGDWFGEDVAVSDDGRMMAVAARGDDSGVAADPGDDDANGSGAVYVFERDDDGNWSEAWFLKAAVPGVGDGVGYSLAISGDGTTIAVGAISEDGGSSGIDGDPNDDSLAASGAVYVFERDALGWSQRAYVKASNTDAGDLFGYAVALDDDGDTLAVSTSWEESAATGIDGDQLDDSAPHAGAAYLFARDAMGIWSQRAYIKASNTEEWDSFGSSVALSGDGNTLAVGATGESSASPGINGDEDDDGSANSSGAAYVFTRDATDEWTQQAYVKAANPTVSAYFGASVALSDDGDTLAVGATRGVEDNYAAGVVYLFARNDDDEWTQAAHVVAPNPGPNFGFGREVSLSDDGLVLAASVDSDDSAAIGIGGDDLDASLENVGGAHAYARDAMGVWQHRAYVKPIDPASNLAFARRLSLSADGTTLAISAAWESSASDGIGGDPTDHPLWAQSGAVYVY